ncbi:transcriptional regulator GcvA [Pseudemcibacter aquimaris]|uniref:transcriptional regulator GcvA n=1 Tax=Pseudemcibacter aquimaris TaxID=2857064 RepID=UPI0020112E2A|nr:transcriptional regulator GcvA [Pseudemcibacter aquimaris]MCC3861199.1 transcriptional regulator GcvA [Pseudemcibacter aquimaris]WDU57974.1 transcriptional regulator GcvA [Pseudemcibacter aquimaris]
MKRALLPLNALRAFDAAARHLSFKKAAEEISVTPAAISQQIRTLEDYLGVQLFVRDKQVLRLTKPAERALPSLEEAFKNFEITVGIMQESEKDNDLRLTLSPSFASKWLIPRLGRFQEEYPEIAVRVSASMEIINFRNSDFDLAVRYGRGNYPDLYVEELMKEEVYAVCSPDLVTGDDSIKTYEDLKDVTLIHDDSSLEDESCPKWDMWLKAVGVTLPENSKRLHFNTTQLALEAAVAGRGVAIAKGTIAKDDVDKGKLVKLFCRAQPVDFAYYIVCPEAKKDIPKIKHFISWLRKEASL